MVEIGNWRNKADPQLVVFVLGCIVITIVLLIAMQRAEAEAFNISSPLKYYFYLN